LDGTRRISSSSSSSVTQQQQLGQQQQQQQQLPALLLPPLNISSSNGDEIKRDMGATSEFSSSSNNNNNNNNNNNKSSLSNLLLENSFRRGDDELLSPADAAASTSTGYVPAPERPLSPGLVALMMAMEESEKAGPVNKTELRNRAKERVTQQAYLRCLESVENQAKIEETIDKQALTLQEQWEERQDAKVQGLNYSKRQQKTLLDAQITEHSKVLQREKEEKQKMVASFFLGPNAGNVTKPAGSFPGGPNHKEIRKELNRDLTFQIRSNAERQARLKMQDLLEERAYLDHVAMELDLQYVAERAAHLEKQRTLLEAWERDGHIRNLRKLQMAGTGAVKDYIYVNLPEAVEEQQKKAAQFSVGYDTRRGRL